MTTDSEPTRIPVGSRVTIYQRGKKGTWTAEFWSDGDHRRKSLKTVNKKIAVERATKLSSDLIDGVHQRLPRDTAIDDAIKLYLDHLRTERRARKTIVRYQGELETFRDFCVEQNARRLSRVTLTLFDSYRKHRSNLVAARTLYHESVVCKQFFKWCVSRRLLNSNPLNELRLVKPIPTSKNVLSFDQVSEILRNCSEQRRALVAVLAFTGMRSGELRQLRRNDVDLDGGWFHIVSREGFETKTRTSRKVPIHPVLVPMLREHKPESGDWFFSAAASQRYPDGGRPINGKKLNERFQVTLRKAKLPTGRATGGFTLHSLRDFFETYCVNAGVPQRVVDTWLGHRSDRSMASVYYHLSDDESQRFMGGLGFKLP